VNWLLPSGEVRSIPPKELGLVRNGHHIKYGANPNESTAWDQSFESEFDSADSNFPTVIAWLESLPRESRFGKRLRERFLPLSASDEDLYRLVEGIVSLAVRSPMNRAMAVQFSDDFGPLPPAMRESVRGLNMRDMQRLAVQSIGTRGKFVVLYSPEKEFIFGDGFFHNITTPNFVPYAPEILAPITPNLSVLYVRPLEYGVEPKLTSFVIDESEANILNDVVQVYSKDAVFFRSEKPNIIDAFGSNQHQRYSHPGNPIANLIHTIPGVPDRDRSWDHFFNK